jgi:hypothetical protein
MKNTMALGFAKLERDYNSAAPKALYRTVAPWMEEMKDITPVQYGTLRDSGQVDKPEWKAGVLTITLGFGGAAEEYAIYVHEDLEAFHAVGEAKFMEKIIKKNEPSLMSDFGDEIVAMLGL